MKSQIKLEEPIALFKRLLHDENICNALIRLSFGNETTAPMEIFRPGFSDCDLLHEQAEKLLNIPNLKPAEYKAPSLLICGLL